jgi:erythrose-4-phosphate dehydrogenase
MRLAINGYGRIGRCILRALYESGRQQDIKIVGINELYDIGSIAHLTRFDSTHGIFGESVDWQNDELRIGSDRIRISREPDLSLLPWRDLEVDIVLECSGSFVERQTAMLHLDSGADKVLFSCPAQPDVDATIVYGLNHDILDRDCRIVSNASCTTNCISHIIRILHEAYNLQNGVITTVHSMMNDQPVIDAYHNPDLRKSRSSSASIIPVHTELARGIERIFPDLHGRFNALALRVPVYNVSTMRLTAQVNRPATAAEINQLFLDASRSTLNTILDYTELPLVSCDFNHNSHSAVIDGSHTSVCGDSLVNVMAWFDNEWGFANRMLDTAWAMHTAP